MRYWAVSAILLISSVLAQGEEWSSSKPKPPVADKKFVFLATIHTAAMIADYETTQGCIARNSCYELNPIFGSRYPSRRRMYAIGGAITAASVYSAYSLKRKKKRYWFVPLLAGTAVHGYLAYRNSQF